MHPDPKLSSQGLARLIEQVGKACYNLGYTPGLNPAQWAALRYFQDSEGNRPTVTGFANSQGTTKGTASQTVAALVRKGYLQRIADENDRRVHRLVLTPIGDAMAEQDPLQKLTNVVDRLDEKERWSLAVNMERILRELIRT